MFRQQKTLKVCKNEKTSSVFFLKNHLKGKKSQTLAGVLCCVSFCTIFGVFTYLMIMGLKNHIGDEANQAYRMMQQAESKTIAPKRSFEHGVQKFSLHNPCIVNKCDVTCTGFIEDLSSNLIQLNESNALDCLSIRLIMKEAVFPDNTIPEYWLTNNQIQIFYLKITKTFLKTIEPGAFESRGFKKTIDLYLDCCIIETLKNNTFKGLNSLKELNVWQSNITNVEKDALVGISNSIMIMSVRKSLINVYQLLADINFPSLMFLFLSETYFHSISKNIFSGLKAARYVNINSCNVSEIENGSFDSLVKLEHLDLGHNLLTTLPDNFLHTTSIQHFKISHNRWNCTCKMNWVKQLKLVENDFSTTECYDSYGKIIGTFSDVKFCDESDSCTRSTCTTNSQPTDPQQSTTGSDNANQIPLYCSSYLQKSIFNYKDPGNLLNKFLSKTSAESKRKLGINVFEKNAIVYVKAFPPFFRSDVLIWFSSNFNYTALRDGSLIINCLTNMCTNLVEIPQDKIEPGELYTFCVMRNGKRDVYPFDCKPFQTQLPWGERSWITKEDKSTVVVTVVSSTILCYILGGAVVYILIRRNPILLRGSKRVVMVKNSDTKVIVLPAESKNSYSEQGCNSRSNSVVLKRNNLKRSVSETSIVSEKSSSASYVSALEPTPAQLLHWRLERLRGGIESGGALTEVNDAYNTSPSLASRPNIYIDVHGKSADTDI